MSTTVAAPRSRPPAVRESGRGVFIFVGLAVLILAMALLMIGVVVSGAVIGTEFNPQTFTVRSFGYYELPIVHLQIYPISRSERAGQLEKHLKTEKLLPTIDPQAVNNWHLADVRRGGAVVERGDADLLVSYFETTTATGVTPLLEWSKAHPDQARVLWPVVARLARRHDYLLVPQLFELAAGQPDPATLDAKLRERLVADYVAWAKSRRQLGDEPTAKTLLDEAAHWAGDRQELRQKIAAEQPAESP